MKKSNQKPPKFATRFFTWWCKRAEIEDLLGDLEENFQYNYDQRGALIARLIYLRQIVSLTLSYAIRKRKQASAYSSHHPTNSIAMFRNYVKIAVRNFAKHKLFTSINILGLALGMSLCVLALSVIVSIYRFDEFHENKERVFQVNTHISDVSGTENYGSTLNALGPYMKENYPFIERVTQIKSGFAPTVDQNGNFLDFHGYYVGESFFETFSFPLILGNPTDALSKPFNIVLTKSVAEKLYREANPMGKVLKTQYGNFTVSGVIADFKESHFYGDVLTTFSTHRSLQKGNTENDWVNYRNNYVYLLLKPDTESAVLNEALNQSAKVASSFNPDKKILFEAVALDEIVPSWNLSNVLGVGWDLPTMIVFMAIGFLVLLPAIFNYTNMSIAQALKRAKEIGIRKVVGAEKRQIKMQFIVETVLLTLLALFGSVGIFQLIKGRFLGMIIASETLDISFSPSLIVVLILFSIFIGLLAGLFPAIYFSRLNPIHTIKGEIQNRKGSVSGIRKGLFVFQFFLSLVFIIGVTAITSQYVYVLNNNHGFDSNNILVVPFNKVDKQLAMNELGNHPDVRAITSSSNLPGLVLPQTVELTHNELDTIVVNQAFIGDNFMENFNLKVLWGNTDELNRSTQNEEHVFVNQQFMRSIRIFNKEADSLSFILADGTRCHIAGVMEDFNFEPLNRLISPLIFRKSLSNCHYALLTLNSLDIRKTVSDLEGIWTDLDQKAKFEASFLDDEIEESYQFLVYQIEIFGFLSIMAITISCLGLLGMVSYTTENRTKEIAIRKIMGASERSLYFTLTKDFIKLIAIGSMIAIPFSYFFYDWVFLKILIQYGKGLGALEMIASILFLFLIGFLAIYGQASKIAKSNPATNLRNE